MKAVLRGKFIPLNSPIKKTEQEHINTLREHLRQLETEEQTKSKAQRREEIIKIRAEINSIETIQDKREPVLWYPITQRCPKFSGQGDYGTSEKRDE